MEVQTTKSESRPTGWQVTAIIAVIVIVVVLAFVFGTMPSRRLRSTTHSMPEGMYHQAGAYAINSEADVRQAKSAGLTYSMTGYQDPADGLVVDAQDPHFQYVDGWIENRIYDRYHHSCGV